MSNISLGLKSPAVNLKKKKKKKKFLFLIEEQ
jgi:hypothetical protein